MNKDTLIIAVDGHSSCGKSTLAKDLAKHFHYRYIDTGAMYRAVTLFALKNGMIQKSIIDTEKLEEAFKQKKVKIDFQYNSDLNKSETYLNGENVEEKIRGIEVSSYVSPIAELAFVRYHLVKLQREMGKAGGIVMDGRDIGTNVFPNAGLKIFLTADAKIRAERRFKELTKKGNDLSFEEVLKNDKNEWNIYEKNRAKLLEDKSIEYILKMLP